MKKPCIYAGAQMSLYSRSMSNLSSLLFILQEIHTSSLQMLQQQ